MMPRPRPFVSVRYLRVERVWCLLPYLEAAFPSANTIVRLIGRSRSKDMFFRLLISADAPSQALSGISLR
ncbi:hypothetical protein SAMN05880582_101534 [Rhizobium sp. RU20A]|nr:hypothetical protein SAMN05880582_101534 [Rhizobium sp. RU20A]